MDNVMLRLATEPASIMMQTAGLTRYTKELIKIGSYVKDSAALAFEVTHDTLVHWRDTFHRWIANGLKVGIPLGHDAADKPEKNQGWVLDMYVEGDALVGVLELKDPELALTTDVSIFVPGQHTDGRGNKYVQPIQHVALCTNPVIPGLKGFEQLSLSEGVSSMKLNETLCKMLDLKDADDDAIVAAVKAKSATPGKKDADKVLSQELTALSPLVKLVQDNRGIKISALVGAGLISPAVKTAIEEQYIKPESLALSMSSGHDDGFDFLVKIIAENKTVPLGEKTAAQLLELANTRAAGEANPIEKDVTRRRTEAGLDK